jgi:hypothetical protein
MTQVLFMWDRIIAKKGQLSGNLFLLVLSLFFSPFAYSQKTEATITDADFKKYPDCQQYQNWIRNGVDSLVLYFSYDFDKQGTLVRKFNDHPYDTKELTLYSFDDQQRLLEEKIYRRTLVKNRFQISTWNYFYNAKGQQDSAMREESYPVFDYISLDKKNDTDTQDSVITGNTLISGDGNSDTVEFDEPILAPIDSSVYERAVLTIGDKMIKGYRKVKKRAVLRSIQSYKALTFIYSYNSKGQKIKKFMDAEESDYAGSTTFIYDNKGRVSEIFYRYENVYKARHGAKADSIYRWRDLFYRYRDSTLVTTKTREKIAGEKADTLIHYNAYFSYNEDGSVTETAVFPNVTYKQTSYRNKKGQIIKTVNSRIRVQNKYGKGKFISTDIKKIPASDYSLYEKTAVYSYDSHGRIIRRTTNYLENDKGKSNTYELYIIFNYKDDRPLKLPEKEYVDLIDEFNYRSEQ